MKWRSWCHSSCSEWGFCRLLLAMTSALLQYVDGSLPIKTCLVVPPVYVKKSWCGCLLVAFDWLPLEWFNFAYVLTLSSWWLWLIYYSATTIFLGDNSCSCVWLCFVHPPVAWHISHIRFIFENCLTIGAKQVKFGMEICVWNYTDKFYIECCV
jgi:hypothetical protein